MVWTVSRHVNVVMVQTVILSMVSVSVQPAGRDLTVNKVRIMRRYAIDRSIEQGLTSHQHIIDHIGVGFIRVKWPNQQCQSTASLFTSVRSWQLPPFTLLNYVRWCRIPPSVNQQHVLSVISYHTINVTPCIDNSRRHAAATEISLYLCWWETLRRHAMISVIISFNNSIATCSTMNLSTLSVSTRQLIANTSLPEL